MEYTDETEMICKPIRLDNTMYFVELSPNVGNHTKVCHDHDQYTCEFKTGNIRRMGLIMSNMICNIIGTYLIEISLHRNIDISKYRYNEKISCIDNYWNLNRNN